MRTQHPWAYDWNAAPVFDRHRCGAADARVARRARAARYLAYTLRCPSSPSTSSTCSSNSAASEHVSPSRMFGGVGLYQRRVVLRTHRRRHAVLQDRRQQQRRIPRRATCRDSCRPVNRPMGPIGYHQVPADIIEDADALVSWGRKSVAVALAAKQAKSARTSRVRTAEESAGEKARFEEKGREKEARAQINPPPGALASNHPCLGLADQVRRATRRAASRSSRGIHRRGWRRRASCRRSPRRVLRWMPESRTPCAAARTACRARVARRLRPPGCSRTITISGGARYSASASIRLTWPCGNRLSASHEARSVRSAASSQRVSPSR